MEVTLPTDLNLAPDFNVCVFHHRVFTEEAPSFLFGGDKQVFLGRAQIPVCVASVDPSTPQWYAYVSLNTRLIVSVQCDVYRYLLRWYANIFFVERSECFNDVATRTNEAQL